MVLKGIKLLDIARQEKVSDVYVWYVINSLRNGPKIRKAIAKTLGMKVSDLWPSNNHRHKRRAA